MSHSYGMLDDMDRWYTSDLHFGHVNLIKKGHRPYASLDEMHDVLIEGWNSVVSPGDEVWVLGDYALRPYEESLAFTPLLNGTKVLVPGNHDGCWAGKFTARDHPLRAIAIQSLYTRIAGFSAIEDNPQPHLIAGERVALSHFPYEADHTDVVRFPEWRPIDYGGWLLHGHLHEMWRQHGRQINVGVDAWGMRPVHIETIAEMIKGGPADRGPLPLDYKAAA